MVAGGSPLTMPTKICGQTLDIFVFSKKDGDRPVNALYRGDRFAGYAADAA